MDERPDIEPLRPWREDTEPTPTPRPARWGLGDAIGGFVAGFVLSNLAAAVVAVGTGAVRAGVVRLTLPTEVASLAGLWIGLVGAALYASRRKGGGRLSEDFGLELRPFPDLPLGAAIGAGSQLLLLPLVYLPLRGVVPHLDRRLSQPAERLTNVGHGGTLAVVVLLVVVGAPVVEELFFRGLLLRALDRRLAGLGRRLGPPLAVVVSALAFGLAHAEQLQLLGLAVFGVVLGTLAERTGRLGPGIVAHAAFNAVAVVALATAH